MYLIYENSIFANFNYRKAFIRENAKQAPAILLQTFMELIHTPKQTLQNRAYT